jgi:hypothetical protein
MADTSGSGADATATLTPANVALSYSPGTQGADTMWKWISGWIILLIILWGINRTRLGHTVMYYSLCLMILFTLVSQYKEVGQYLSVFSGPALSKLTPQSSAVPSGATHNV